MKFIGRREELIHKFSLAGKIIPSRSTLPILNNLYLETTDKGLAIQATNLEHTIKAVVSGKVDDLGKITVPARIVLEYLQNNADEDVTLERSDQSLKISSANHRATIVGLPAEEYPTIPEIKADIKLTLKGKQIRDLINYTLFASATSDTQPILNSALWRFDDKNLTVVATDGYRLALRKEPISSSFSQDVLLPRRALQELERLLVEDEAQIEIGFSGNQAVFSCPDFTFISRTLEGRYPDFAVIIPQKKREEVLLSAASLSQSLKLASLFSRDSAFSTKLNFKDKQLIVTAVSPQVGNSSNELELTEGVKQEIAISINAQYFLDFLTRVGGDVNIGIVDEEKPIVLSLPKEENYLYLVMPLRNS